jgi:hypothetical protein
VVTPTRIDLNEWERRQRGWNEVTANLVLLRLESQRWRRSQGIAPLTAPPPMFGLEDIPEDRSWAEGYAAGKAAGRALEQRHRRDHATLFGPDGSTMFVMDAQRLRDLQLRPMRMQQEPSQPLRDDGTFERVRNAMRGPAWRFGFGVSGL